MLHCNAGAAQSSSTLPTRHPNRPVLRAKYMPVDPQRNPPQLGFHNLVMVLLQRRFSEETTLRMDRILRFGEPFCSLNAPFETLELSPTRESIFPCDPQVLAQSSPFCRS